MWSIFKGSKEKQLRKEYARLMADAHRLSKSNRMEADKKYARAESVMDQLSNLKST